MLRILPVVCAAALLAASGVAQRLWTGAWSGSDKEPAAFAERLANIPLNIGPWRGTEGELDQAQLTTSEATGHILREYVRPDTDTRISVLILCGRPGPMCVHQPTVCYGGIGFEKDKETAYKVPAEGEVPPADFNRLDLKKPDTVATPRLRIYYGWNAGAGWHAPSNPRLKFGGVGALYKMYVVYRPATGTELADNDPAQDFLRDLLPELERALTPAS